MKNLSNQSSNNNNNNNSNRRARFKVAVRTIQASTNIHRKGMKLLARNVTPYTPVYY